jgi:hypothetical protein
MLVGRGISGQGSLYPLGAVHHGGMLLRADPAERLQLQLQDLAAREVKLTQQLEAMPAAA